VKRIAVLGAGGHAKVVLSTLLAAGFSVEGLLDKDEQKWGQKILGVPVLGPLEMVRSGGFSHAVIAIGDNKIRKEVAERFNGYCDWITVVHPYSFVHPSVQIGKGTVIFAGVIIQPDTVLGDHVILNTGVTVDHDCVVANFVHLAPGVHLAGSVIVEEGGFLGTGSVVIPGKKVGRWAIVGAGAVVIRDVPPLTTVVGVPAKPV
jgi:sugar O-acyltransferase (sialic acid O-acetyltransferase NeuD family)